MDDKNATIKDWKWLRPRRWRSTSREFFRALTDPFTYSARRNPDVIIGLLWGLPIPLVVFLVHLFAKHQAVTPQNLLNVLTESPVYFIFVLHPLLFAVVFGAMGTMRALRDGKIAHLLDQEMHRSDELAKANAQLLELDHMKTEFLANVTHELKSPLVTAIGYTDRLLGKHLGPITERQQHGLEVGKRNLIRLRNLIDEILDFSRLDAGVVKMHLEPMDLAEVITSVVESDALKARERSIALETALPPGRVMVRGDKTKLYQVILNLIDNAIKFSTEGKKVQVSVQAGLGGCWNITVEDRGCGIPAEVIPNLFQRFYQADGSLARVHEGVGLGLVIVKKIVEAHGGQIWIESEVGVGTKVHLQLPSIPEIRSEAKVHETEADHVANPIG